MKTLTQLKALIRNLSRDKGINAEILLMNFMLERLLERYRSNNEYSSDISWEDTVSSMKRTFSKINLS